MKNPELIQGLKSFSADIRRGTLLFGTDDFPEAFRQAMLHNKWFVRENIIEALNHWADLLDDETSVGEWLSAYPDPVSDPKKMLLVLPGNLPAVGFHDVLCTLLSGHRAEIKLSSDDRFLIPWLLDRLSAAVPQWKGRYTFHEGLIKDFDAVIVTGSNQTAQTLAQYFSGRPSLIRHHRNSLAIINESDTNEDLENIAGDVFRYFGLGCRSVSLLFLPAEFDLQRIFDAFKSWLFMASHNAWANNYDYYKGYFTLMKEELLDGGFYLLRKNESLHGPVAVINIVPYTDANEFSAFIQQHSDQIQCVVSSKPHVAGAVAPGRAQFPPLHEYADGVDTLRFLMDLK